MSVAFDPTLPLARAKTPPASWYCSAEHDRIERQAVLGANWQVVAHRDQLQEPGHFVAGCAGQEPWVVVCQPDQTLRAFANVCRHNGTQVAQGSGRTDQLVCPYHGWRYGLDGQLVKAPRTAGIEGFLRQDYALKPLGLTCFGPLVMINTSGLAPKPDLAMLMARLKATDWDALVRIERRSYALRCNWKVFVDNYLDGGYHVPFLHHDLASELQLEGYQTELFDGGSIQSVPSKTGASSRLAGEALYAWVYPNLMINRYGTMMDINVVTPTGPQSCRVDFDWYAQPGLDATIQAKRLAASEQVQMEDIAICESLQIGMGSRHFEPGPYAPTLEMGKFQFHGMVAADLARHARA